MEKEIIKGRKDGFVCEREKEYVYMCDVKLNVEGENEFQKSARCVARDNFNKIQYIKNRLFNCQKSGREWTRCVVMSRFNSVVVVVYESHCGRRRTCGCGGGISFGKKAVGRKIIIGNTNNYFWDWEDRERVVFESNRNNTPIYIHFYLPSLPRRPLSRNE